MDDRFEKVFLRAQDYYSEVGMATEIRRPARGTRSQLQSAFSETDSTRLLFIPLKTRRVRALFRRQQFIFADSIFDGPAAIYNSNLSKRFVQ